MHRPEKYGFGTIEQSLKELTGSDEKIDYLQSIKIEARKLSVSRPLEISSDYVLSLEKHCDLLIERCKVRKDLDVENMNKIEKQPLLSINSKELTKSDSVRLITAIWKAGMFMNDNGKRATLKNILDVFNSFSDLNLDMSQFKDFKKQALNQSEDANSEVFERLRNCIKSLLPQNK